MGMSEEPVMSNRELIERARNAIEGLNPLTCYGEDAVWRPANKAWEALRDLAKALEEAEADAVEFDLQATEWASKHIDSAARAEKAEAENTRLREALEGWFCPSCGGSKTYLQRDQTGERVVPCKVCEATGLHPKARAALAPLGEGA